MVIGYLIQGNWRNYRAVKHFPVTSKLKECFLIVKGNDRRSFCVKQAIKAKSNKYFTVVQVF